ncbi:MAG: hypothetical protein AB7F08_11410 [Dongiaceae bacterium]
MRAHFTLPFRLGAMPGGHDAFAIPDIWAGFAAIPAVENGFPMILCGGIMAVPLVGGTRDGRTASPQDL